jgi:hypothetical protein
VLQKFVDFGLKQGVGIESEDVARVLYEVPDKGGKVPLHLTLSMNALGLMGPLKEGRRRWKRLEILVGV